MTTAAREGAATAGRAVLLMACVAQAMLGIDLTIVNVALPEIHASLGFTGDGLAWVVDGYALAYGGLVLAGGRVADLAGRRTTFMAGIALFAAASLSGGLAGTASWLIAARFAQGIGAALTSPAALSLAATSRSSPRDRQKAVAAFAASGAIGAASGQLVGGVLTSELSWRWVLWVNVPVGMLLFAGAWFLLRGTAPQAQRRALDIPGTVLVTSGMLCLTYAILEAGNHGWRSRNVLAAGGAACLLLVSFGVAEARSREPLLPRRLLSSRPMLLALLTGALAYGWLYSAQFFLTQYMQDVHGWSPLRTGTYWIPAGAASVVGMMVARRLLGRVHPALLAAIGALCWLAASLMYARIHPGTAYLPGLLPGFAISGLGLGLAIAAYTAMAIASAGPRDIGTASGMLGTAQQLGASVSLAALATVATSSSSRIASGWLAAHPGSSLPRPVAVAALSHGFAAALTVTIAIAAAGVTVQLGGARRAKAAYQADPSPAGSIHGRA